MKKHTKILLFVLFLCGTVTLFSNPIVEIFINEVYFESGEWTIELNSRISYDGWYIKTSADSAYFKDGLNTFSEYPLITSDSMQSNLFINPFGDYISLYEQNGHLVEQIIFGDFEGSSVLGPGEGQSICLGYSSGNYNYYLDQTPTLGSWNDTINANGIIDGYVYDSVGIPIYGARIQYDYIDDYYFPYALYVNSDNNGYYRINYLGVLANLEISKDSYETKYVEVQIWPDSNCTIDTIQLNGPITEIVEQDLEEYDFVLLNNYPNPFNPATKIQFTIPVNVISTEGRNLGDFSSSSTSRNDNSSVVLKVYDILGNEITTLVNEQKPPGTYEVEFDGEGLTTGIYFYKLSAGKYSETKKMLLMK